MDTKQLEMMVIEQVKQMASLENSCTALENSVDKLMDVVSMHQTAIDKIQTRQSTEDAHAKVMLTKEGWVILAAFSLIDVISLFVVHLL